MKKAVAKKKVELKQWKGYYEVGNEQFPMEMMLSFTDNKIEGLGEDGIGKFVITGESEVVGAQDRVHFIKKYEDKHSVDYKGTEKMGVITGDWSTDEMHDRFKLNRIYPKP